MKNDILNPGKEDIVYATKYPITIKNVNIFKGFILLKIS